MLNAKYDAKTAQLAVELAAFAGPPSSFPEVEFRALYVDFLFILGLSIVFVDF